MFIVENGNVYTMIDGVKVFLASKAKTYKASFVPNTNINVEIFFDKPFSSIDDYDFEYESDYSSTGYGYFGTPSKHLDRITIPIFTNQNVNTQFYMLVTVTTK